MADQQKKLVFDVVARINKLESAMKKAAGVSDQQMGKVEKRAQTMVLRVDQHFEKIGGSIKSGMLSALAGIGAGAAAAMAPVVLFNAALKELGNATALVRLSERIGLSTTALQVLQQQAELVGVNVDTMGDGLGDFAAKIAEASAGAGPLYEIFKANNVELRKADGTLKSTRDLLGNYADLIRNAGSEAEALFLAQEAFGDEAAKMVPLFKQGAAGLAEMEKAAVGAGKVIDEDIVKRAAEMDKRWAAAWQNFGINARSAVLSAVEGMDQLNAAFADYERRKTGAAAGASIGAMAGQTNIKRSRLGTPDDRVADAFTTEIAAADAKLVDALRKRYGAAASQTTIIPGSGGGGDKPGKGAGATRNKEAEEALRQAESVLDLIEALKIERAEIGMTDAQRAKSQALREAGTAATAAQRSEIEMLVDAIYAESEATEKASAAAQELRDVGRDVLGGFISDMQSGKKFADSLADALSNISNRLLNSGLDALFGGGGGGGLFGGLFGGGQKALALGGGVGLYSGGGYTGSGGVNDPAGVVHKGEVVWSQRDVARAGGVGVVEAMRKGLSGYAGGGVVMPNLPTIQAPIMPRIPQLAKSGGGGSVSAPINITIDATGADSAGLARVQNQLAILKAELPSRVVAAVTDANKRGVKLG